MAFLIAAVCNVVVNWPPCRGLRLLIVKLKIVRRLRKEWLIARHGFKPQQYLCTAISLVVEDDEGCLGFGCQAGQPRARALIVATATGRKLTSCP